MKVPLFNPKPLNLIPKILFLLGFALSIQAVDDEYYTECNKPYLCGSITEIKYPFRGNDRAPYCGFGDYHVTCEKGMTYPIFGMGSQYFKVLKIIQSTLAMVIARDDLFDDLCHPISENTDIDTTLVNYAPDTENLTIFYGCNSSVLHMVEEKQKFGCGDSEVVSLNELRSNTIWSQAREGCHINIAVQVMTENLGNFKAGTLQLLDMVKDGFKVTYIYPRKRIDSCNKCEDSGGICGTNTTTKDEFACFCKDGPRAESCPSRGSSFLKTMLGKTRTQKVIMGVCSVVGIFLLIIGFSCFYKVVKNGISKRRKKKFFKQNGGSLLQQQLLSGDGNVKKIKVFKSSELEKATNHYDVDRVLGQGGQGTVYKGILPNARLVAVKKSKIVDTANVGQFINEIVILSQINHRNVVKLLGCCLETDVPMLIYEFISNGTLFQQIHNPKEDFQLTWKMRLRIVAEIACTLSYLHNSAPVPIYHRDIKSTNILLDDKYHAKVSDFGISRSVDVDTSHLTTLVRGTFGYLDPEYYQSSQFTEKSDVYSFGVVLAELLTGQKPIFSNTAREFKGLASHFIESMEESCFLSMIDPQLSKEVPIEELVEVAHLAKACLNSIGKRRPTMKEVAAQLDGIRMSREQAMTRENDEFDHVEACVDSSTALGGLYGSSTTSSVNKSSFLDA